MGAKLSIRLRITLWFCIAMVIIVAATYYIVLFVSENVIQKTVRDSLIQTVENNVDEVEFFETLQALDQIGDVDHFLYYNTGYLEIDDDFLNRVNDVCTALYVFDGSLVYGENPIAKETSGISFADSKVQTITVQGTVYYVFDRKLTKDGLQGLWLRGVVSEEQGAAQLASISHTSLMILPTIVLITAIGGYIFAGRMLRPIRKIADSARQISRGKDLHKRIVLSKGNDELHQLARDFNDMVARLENAFLIERQFTSDASHELRTPLCVILAQCELSLSETSSPAEYKEAIEIIHRQAKKMTGLINSMLDFTRLQLKSDQYEKQMFDLSDLVQNVVQEMALIAEKQIVLSSFIQPDIQYTGNKELFSRLLSNLISNAYRYGRENGHIFVSLRKENAHIRLSVRDDGIGISPEDLPHIFERFYQADPSRSGNGAGLGLAMVKEIVQFHGGEISVKSTVAQGSEFTVLL